MSILSRKIVIVVSYIFLIYNAGYSQMDLPPTILIQSEVLSHNKKLYKQNDKDVVKNVNTILREANQLVESDIFYTVTRKALPPNFPSIQKSDYLSLAPYWWPNTRSKNGLPYIARDGKINPESKKISDQEELRKLGLSVRTLGLAYYFSNNESYVLRSLDLLDKFFINSKYRMNPNFEYSQFILGEQSSGGNSITVNELMNVIDGIQLLKTSSVWDKKIEDRVRSWFSEFLSWMLNSKKGLKNSRAPNNIGTYYTVQTVTLAIFLNDINLAKQIYRDQAFLRIDKQIDNQGGLPQETKRHASNDYIAYTADAFVSLKVLGDHLGMDVWNYVGKGGGSLPLLFRKITGDYTAKEKRLNSNFMPFVRRNSYFLKKAGVLVDDQKVAKDNLMKNMF